MAFSKPRICEANEENEGTGTMFTPRWEIMGVLRALASSLFHFLQDIELQMIRRKRAAKYAQPRLNNTNNPHSLFSQLSKTY